MAVTKTLIKAVPRENSSSEVEQWDLTMKYEQGDKTLNEETGEYTYAANYFEASYFTEIRATEPVLASSVEGESTYTTTTNFNELDKTAWSLAALIALCPISEWDSIFDSQYDSIITNPRTIGAPDDSFVIPS